MVKCITRSVLFDIGFNVGFKNYMLQIYLVEGPVGSGKTTFAHQLSNCYSAPHLNLDDWMARLFRPDRSEIDVMAWYIERKERCKTEVEHC